MKLEICGHWIWQHGKSKSPWQEQFPLSVKRRGQMNLSAEQERHGRVQIVMGRTGLHCPGAACRGTPGSVAIVSEKRMSSLRIAYQEKREVHRN